MQAENIIASLEAQAKVGPRHLTLARCQTQPALSPLALTSPWPSPPALTPRPSPLSCGDTLGRWAPSRPRVPRTWRVSCCRRARRRTSSRRRSTSPDTRPEPETRTRAHAPIPRSPRSPELPNPETLSLRALSPRASHLTSQPPKALDPPRFAAQVEGLRTRVASQLQARADALAALSSSRAFLHRGFRDIEMLLEAGFTELETKRALFMGVGKKKVPLTLTQLPHPVRCCSTLQQSTLQHCNTAIPQ